MLLRCPTARDSRLRPYSGSSSTSGICTTVGSRIARPAPLARPGGVGQIRPTSSSAAALKLCCATKWTSSPSNRTSAPNSPPHSFSALRTIVSKTGCTSVRERLMRPRTSPVAVCCSEDSVSARRRLSTSVFRYAYDPVVGLAPFKGLAQSSQNLAAGRFSCWHRGHFIAYSPRAGRGSGLATIARGRGRVNNGASLRPIYLPGFERKGWVKRLLGEPHRQRSEHRRADRRGQDPASAVAAPRRRARRLP